MYTSLKPADVWALRLDEFVTLTRAIDDRISQQKRR